MSFFFMPLFLNLANFKWIGQFFLVIYYSLCQENNNNKKQTERWLNEYLYRKNLMCRQKQILIYYNTENRIGFFLVYDYRIMVINRFFCLYQIYCVSIWFRWMISQLQGQRLRLILLDKISWLLVLSIFLIIDGLYYFFYIYGE